MPIRDFEVEREWQEFWVPLVVRDGVLDVEQVKRELYDFRVAMQEVSKVYDHITGGRVSKVTTRAEVVIDAFEARLKEAVSEALDEHELF